MLHRPTAYHLMEHNPTTTALPYRNRARVYMIRSTRGRRHSSTAAKSACKITITIVSYSSIVEKDIPVHLFISTTFFSAFSSIKPRHCQRRGRHGPVDVTAKESPKLFRLDNVLLPLLASKGGQGMLTPKDNMRGTCSNNGGNEIG